MRLNIYTDATKERIYVPEAAQIDFHKSTATWRAYFGGFGCGKTVAGCVEAVKTALKYPGSKGLIGRYTDRELRQTTWMEFKTVLPPELIEYENKAELHLILKNKSQIFGMHLQNEERLRSMNLDWWMIDEACEVSESIFKQLVGRTRNTVGPLRGWLVGNPEGHNWIFRQFVQPWQSGNEKDGHAYFHGKTTDATFLPPSYVENLYSVYDEDWANRFINGSWDVFEGQVFPMFDRDIHVLPADFKIPREWARFRAVDHGWSDPTACVWVALDGEGNHYVYNCYYQARRTIDDNCHSINLMSEGESYVYSIFASNTDKTDPGTGKRFSELYREAGLNLQEQRSRLMSGVERVRELLQIREGRKHPGKRGQKAAPKLYVLSHCKPVILEFQQYRYPTVTDTKNTPDKPLDVNNHTIDAIRAVVMFNPSAMEAEKSGDWEDYFNYLLSQGDETGMNYREIIGNERARLR
jgi:PBSX family phage terminase large subunit